MWLTNSFRAPRIRLIIFIKKIDNLKLYLLTAISTLIFRRRSYAIQLKFCPTITEEGTINYC